MNVKHDGHVIKKYNELNMALKAYNLHIAAWGKLAICLDSDPHSGYIVNNIANIDVIDGFVKGLAYAKKLNDDAIDTKPCTACDTLVGGMKHHNYCYRCGRSLHD